MSLALSVTYRISLEKQQVILGKQPEYWRLTGCGDCDGAFLASGEELGVDSMLVGAGFPIKEIGMVRWLRMLAVGAGGHHSVQQILCRSEVSE